MLHDPLLTTNQAADFLHMTVRFLENRRTVGGGPRYIRVGGRVRYRSADLDAWATANTHTDTTAHRASVAAASR